MTAKLQKCSVALILVLSLFACGCFELDIEMTVYPDKSGQIDASFVMDMAAMEMLSGGMGMPTPIAQAQEQIAPPGLPPDFAKDWKGIDWESASSKDEGNRLHESGRGTFANIDKLKMGDGDITFIELPNGNYEFRLKGERQASMEGLPTPTGGPPGASLEGMEGLGDLMAGMMDAQMGPMMSGLSVKYTVVMPGEVIETNADEYSGRRATWTLDINSLMSAKGMDLHVICGPADSDALSENTQLKGRLTTNAKRSEQLRASGMLSTGGSGDAFDSVSAAQDWGDIGIASKGFRGLPESHIYLRNGRIFEGVKVVLWDEKKVVFKLGTGAVMSLPNIQVSAIVTL